MDMLHHLRVIGRWRKVVIGGTLVGILAAFMATFNVSFQSGATYRHAESWESTSTLFVTQPGFPWGRTTLPGVTGPDATTRDQNGTNFADPSRLSILAVVYAYLAQGNQVGRLSGKLPPGATVTASQISNNNSALPLFTLTATSDTEKGSQALNSQRAQGLQRYIALQQDANSVPENQRVQLSVLNGPTAVKVSSHGIMLAIAMVFLAALASLGVAYMLENLRLARSAEGKLDKKPGRDAAGPMPVLDHDDGEDADDRVGAGHWAGDARRSAV